MEIIKQAVGLEKEGLSQNTRVDTDIDIMRQYIIEAAQSIEDKKLLRLLYIRAKTLKNL